MHLSAKKENLLIWSILWIGLFFYIGFVWLDFQGVKIWISTGWLKLFTTVCALLLSFFGESGKLKVGLFLTVVCDYLLLFTDYYTAGVFLFTFVHGFYCLYHLNKLSHSYKAFLWVPPLLLGVSLCYACMILLDIYFAYLVYKKTGARQSALFFTGLILFALCDMATAIYYFTGTSLFASAIWLFYTPSQLLIGISALEGR